MYWDRLGNEVTSNGEEVPEKDFVVGIVRSGNKFYLSNEKFGFDLISIKHMDNLYYPIKSISNCISELPGHYLMKSQDILKIGWFCFWAGIIKSCDENIAFYQNEDILNEFGVAEAIYDYPKRENDEENNTNCKICYLVGTDQSPLIQPCQCTGSM